MTTTNDTTTAAETLQEPSVYLKDAVNWAHGITLAAINMRVHERLTGEAEALWSAAVDLCEAPRWSVQNRREVQLQLDALLLQPDVLIWMVQQARDHLVKTEAAEFVDVDNIRITSQEPRVSLELQNVVNSVQDLLVGAMDGGCHQHLPPAADALFSAGMDLAEGGSDDEYRFNRRAGYLMAVTALQQAPEVMLQVVRSLRGELLAADPQLAPLAGEVTPLEHTPLAVHHDLDGTDFDLKSDGRLMIHSRFDGAPFVELTPRETYAVLMFMRSPAVVALLEAQNAARMTEDEVSFQDDQAAEAVRLAEAR